MIRHIVLIRFRDELHPHEIDDILVSLCGLRDVIPGIAAATAGFNNSPEGLARSYTHAFTVDFDDAGARDAYLPHPEHTRLGKTLVAAAQGGTEGILVLDYEIAA